MTQANPKAPTTIESNPLTEEHVADYLRDNPDFFTAHEALLTDMVIPHEQGSAVSLVERQITLLREKNSKLEEQQEHLQEMALINDRTQKRMHQITLEIISSEDANLALAQLTESLTKNFNLEQVQVRLFADESHPLENIDRAYVITSESARQSLDEFAPTVSPVCSQLTPSQLKRLFGEYAMAVGSNVVIPLRKGIVHGLIAMGTRDKTRFTPDMDTLYLKRLGEMLAASLLRFIE